MNEKDLTFKNIFIKGAVIFNPVLVQFAGLCPVVAASATLKSAVILSAVMFVDLTVVCVIASALLKKFPAGSGCRYTCSSVLRQSARFSIISRTRL